MATHSNTLAWRIPWREEPGRLQSMGWQRVGHNWATLLYFYFFYFFIFIFFTFTLLDCWMDGDFLPKKVFLGLKFRQHQTIGLNPVLSKHLYQRTESVDLGWQLWPFSLWSFLLVREPFSDQNWYGCLIWRREVCLLGWSGHGNPRASPPFNHPFLPTIQQGPVAWRNVKTLFNTMKWILRQ